ncbi:Bug family tripartite tricarboxylate transporter substrate binding protein [Aquabacter sp. P-9]|uniref:Bug family tripartite tricarboxylate transporter substrate binding protein n=1 Tax=Aquabacter sediminis TaxID=3029197 RepID=UPI00237EE6DA|nr:tripartite tricarboxylate transporter substrate binding protein [Aquabacter sp. P-9]MDE1571151.1 tripartite tricarboxylate transporter substrate binding protein [Aquabacter sp. P-9]
MSRLAKIALAMLAVLLVTPISRAWSQDEPFPTRMVRIVVPFPAGGNSDIMTRVLAKKLSEIWRQPVIVDNKPGGDTLIGTSDVIRAPGDGYTILNNISQIIQNTFLKKNMPFDTFKELRPLIVATETSMYFVVSRQDGAIPADLATFVAQSKRPDSHKTFGSFGYGSTGQLLLLKLIETTSAKVDDIPFKGNRDIILQLLNGEISSSFLPFSAFAPYIDQQKLKAVAATGAARSAVLPDVPTFEEQGVAGFTGTNWNGFFVSAKTPPKVVEKLSAGFNQVLKDPEVIETLKALGLTPVGGDPAKFQAYIDNETEWLRSLVATTGLQPQ